MNQATLAACQASYDRFVRDPYPNVEYPSQRAYILARTGVSRLKHHV